MTRTGWKPKPRGNTTRRGYGAAHQAERRRRLAQHTADSPCSRCGSPLGLNRSRWHLAHLPDRSGYYQGLWCATCNQAEAAHRGSRIGHARRHSTRLTW